MSTARRGLVSRVVRRLFDMIFSVPRGRGRPIPTAAWDRDYRAGKWGHLDSIAEMAHYNLIVGYAFRLALRPRILDVGCGDGVLRTYFERADIGEYIGLDISSIAIANARKKAFPDTQFLVADFDTTPDLGLFDIVIFNESIYYAPDPLSVFEAFSDRVKVGGVLIVSMHDAGMRTAAIWRRLELHHASLYATRLTNERKQTWDVRVFVFASQQRPSEQVQ
jgi:SAM-dependent methyltransferase